MMAAQAAWLGIDPPEPAGQGPMKRQADDLSRDWVERYRIESERSISA